MSQRKKYSAEFKAEAVELARSSSSSVSQVARDIGVGPTLLNRWCREAADSRKPAFQGTGTPRDQELPALKRELAQIKKDILRQGIVVRYATIHCCRHEYPVQLMCRCLRVSRSGYYEMGASRAEPSSA